MHSSLIISWILLSLSALTYEDGCNTADYYWRDFSFGCIPYDAVEIADDGKYIGQAYIHDGPVPATIYPHLGYALAEETFMRKIVRENIKILCSTDPTRLHWEIVDFDKPPDRQMKNAIIGGFDGGNVFIGKTYHKGEWKVGKVFPMEKTWKGLWTSDDKGEMERIKMFYMLKYNSTY